MKLLVPGPVPFDKQILSVQPRSHTDSVFRQTMRQVQDALGKVFGTSGFTAALTGSGSWGAEAGMMNLAGPNSKVLVLSGGLFGQRLAEMARLRGALVHTVELDEEGKVPWGLLGEALKAFKPDLFATVHVDTSTGIMVPVHELLEFVRAASPYTLTLVDTVASAGNIPLALDGLADYAFTASQKGLEAPAGLAPIAVSARGMAHARPASWYGDLKRVWGFWEKGEYHHTPAVPLIEALGKSLVRVLQEGIPERQKRSREAYAFLREALRKDFDFPPENVAASTVAVLYPKREEPSVILLRLKEAGFHVAPGIGPTAGKAIRIGLFGAQARVVQDLAEVILGTLA
jgi:alanine-glyoxylate transaminase/serine-glyoxylate transaminase/serine-pyruvate transaminase